MDRDTAIVIFFCSWVVFYLIAYYGANISAWSSIVISLFLSLIILNIIYPPSRLASDPADFALGFYIAIEIIGVVILAIYIAQKAICDVKEVPVELFKLKC